MGHDITDRKLAEQELRDSEAAMRDLYQVTAAPDLTFDARLAQMLELGCCRFGFDIGMMVRSQNGEDQVIAVRLPNNPSFTIAQIDVFDWREIHQQASSEQGSTDYIGTQVVVRNSVYGTLSFFSPNGSSKQILAVDQVLKLMAQWIGSEIERDEVAIALSTALTRNLLLKQIT